MSYVAWALVAMGSSALTAILVKLAMRQVPPMVALFITNIMLVIAAFTMMRFRGESLVEDIPFGRPLLYLVAAGLTLSVAITSYYIALNRGPLSVVAPIFAMSLVVAAIGGFVFLGEEVRITRVLGVFCAAAAVILITR